MNELRAALNQYVAGTLPRGVTEQRVAAAAAKDPQMVPAMLALIETYRSAGGLNSEFARELQNVLRRSPGTPAPAFPTGSTTSPPGANASKLSLGSVLKGRFVLESIVSGGDQGGMGVVYKALDLIKQEAMDRNPYVAIKVLNESFKQHPDSMKALQREARRAQTLSHPNIINVHDFDRDGGNVFLAMELLDGCALDVVIRRYRPSGGMPIAEALPIIEGLGRALAHAHGRGIVHSDFKPGNAFLTADNTVKVLDFGIARATKLGGGDKTLFDAGKLGALSPSYACCEQFEHVGPDPCDDVYALAVVTYELLTGRHPFEKTDPDNPTEIIKVDSVSARSSRLKPAPVPGLTRRQWNTLKSGLAFSRHDRPRDAGVFLEGMLPRNLPVKTVLLGGVAALLLLVLSAQLLSSYVERVRLQGLTQKLQVVDSATISSALQKLQTFSAEERATVLVNPLVQHNLMGYFARRAHELFDPPSGKYDYRDAIASLKEAQDLSPVYADSRQLNDTIDRVEIDRKSEILHQADQFETRLRHGLLIASQGPNNAQAALATIAQLDPNHPLLTDKRLPIALADQTRASLSAGNLAQATAFLEAGLVLAPGSAYLRDLQDQVHRRQAQQQQQAQIAGLERTLAPLGSGRATLEQFRAQREPLSALQRSSPDNPALAAASNRLVTLVAAEVNSEMQQGQAEAAQSLLGEFGALLPAKFVATQRLNIARLTTPAASPSVARTPSPAPPARVSVEDEQVQALINKLAGVPQTDESSVSQALSNLNGLEELVGKNDDRVRQVRARIGRAYLQQSQGLLSEHRLTEAQRVVDLGQKFGLAPALYTSQQTAIRQAREQLQADNQKLTATAQLEAAKRHILDQASANEVDQAQSQFAVLIKALPAGDPFVTTAAPRAIATAYRARAQKFFAQAQFEEALQAAHSAQEAAPGLSEFQGTELLYQNARQLAVNLSSVTDPKQFDRFKSALDRLRALDPPGYPSFAAGFVRILTVRMNGLDPASAARVRAGIMRLFPEASLAQS
jgi:serine/threonine protein kinase